MNTETRERVVPPKTRRLSVKELEQGICAGDRTTIARAITLIESNVTAHRIDAQVLLKRILPRSGQSLRIGITGAPGVGKSTFIESFGCLLVEEGMKLAVLAVDPSSQITGGSILGDKTRMERLASDSRCFIRPSPSRGTLGGVARATMESMIICEAAGFDAIIVETVGVGQSEVTVRQMVDFFLLLMLPNAGDDLQAIKRGIMELADALLINKADGNSKKRAELARLEYEQALHFMPPATTGWDTSVLTCSALTGAGVKEIWDLIGRFQSIVVQSGEFDNRRRNQALNWLDIMIEEHLKSKFYTNPEVQSFLPQIRQSVIEGELPATVGLDELFKKVNL